MLLRIGRHAVEALRSLRGLAAASGAPQRPDHRARVLSLYRAILREARGMPTANRRAYIERRAKAEFREGRDAFVPGIDARAASTTAAKAEFREGRDAPAGAAGAPAGADFLVALAETQLESAQVQRRLLQELKRKGQLKS
jgi:hypothetical protein